VACKNEKFEIGFATKAHVWASQREGQRPALYQHGATPHVTFPKIHQRQRRDSSLSSMRDHGATPRATVEARLQSVRPSAFIGICRGLSWDVAIGWYGTRHWCLWIPEANPWRLPQKQTPKIRDPSSVALAEEENKVKQTRTNQKFIKIPSYTLSINPSTHPTPIHCGHVSEHHKWPKKAGLSRRPVLRSFSEGGNQGESGWRGVFFISPRNGLCPPELCPQNIQIANAIRSPPNPRKSNIVNHKWMPRQPVIPNLSD
jgi:hypothetical protein